MLVGAGQLGSRYLQGFVSANCHLDITVVDSSLTSLARAKTRWIQAGGENCQHTIRWVEETPREVEDISVAFIVTSAKARAELVRQIDSRIGVHFWILEKVLAQSLDELEIIRRATARSLGVWVNKPFRMMSWHKSLKERFVGRGPLKANYSGTNWGLACNGIHYIDLVAWFSGESIVSVSTNSLDQQWHESKRDGYFEVTGKLQVIFSKGSSLDLESKSEARKNSFEIELSDETLWVIDENAGVARSSTGHQIGGTLELQSQLSSRLIDNVILRSQCELPTLEESISTHKVFLEALLLHWNLSQNRKDVCVPIT